jgi:isoamylase
VSFFAPHPAYACGCDPLGAVNEVSQHVQGAAPGRHRGDLGCGFNHTAEGGAAGPTFCWRGFDNRAYYLLDPTNQPPTWNTPAAGTVNANHSVVRRMIVDALHHWVE